MQIILLEKIKKLGKIGDVVKVKPGFARNFLLPNKKAMSATKENLQIFEKQKAKIEEENSKSILEAEKIKKKIADVEIIILREASENGNLYGSVTKRDISTELKKLGFVVNQSQIDLTKIKETGIHECSVSLHPEVKTELKLNIAKTTEEAKAISRKSKDPKTEKVEKNKKASAAPESKKKIDTQKTKDQTKTKKLSQDKKPSEKSAKSKVS